MNVIKANSPTEAAKIFAKNQIEQGFVFVALHEYKDVNGDAIYWRIRCEHPDGEKWIRPMYADMQGKYYLGEPAEFQNAAKPLYGLHLLTQYPNACVWIVEGEKCADRLNQFFATQDSYEHHIATTSGGATSSDKADWKPLQGRECIIWPDNDVAGINYAQQVFKILQEYTK